MEKAVIITGAARRVGAYFALYFAERGYDIALHYNHSQNDALIIQEKTRALGVNCELFAQDLKNISELAPLMQRIHEKMPHANTLINNASIFERAEFMETDEAIFDRQFTVNFKAPFFLTQAFAKFFGKNSGANVINMLDSDIVGTGGSHFAYLLSKKALADFTKMAARALGGNQNEKIGENIQKNIRVNAVCVGCALPSDPSDTSYEEKMAKIIPLRSHPTLAELAEAAYWLTQQRSITGQIIYVDGGKHVI